MSKKYRKSTPIGKLSKAQTAKNYPLALQRDGEVCIVSGSSWALKYPCAGVLTPQHSVNRKMGSSAKYDGVDFLRVMCSFHNSFEMANSEFRSACFRNGWSVPAWVVDQFGISSIPVKYPDGWFLLENGAKLELDETTAEKARQETRQDYDYLFQN